MTSPAQNRFVVVASQRTGSTLLVRSIDASPHIYCAGEIFHAGPGVYHAEHQFPYRFLGSRSLSKLIRLRLRPRLVEQHLQRFYAYAAPHSAAIGFKMMVSQIRSLPRIMPFLKSQGTSIFYLSRSSTFDTALSYYKAQRSGIYHSDKAASATTDTAINVDENVFEKLFFACQRDKDDLMKLHRHFGGYLMNYEDMIARWESFIAEFGERIGVPALRIERRLAKVNTPDSSVRMTNEAALRARFAHLEANRTSS